MDLHLISCHLVLLGVSFSISLLFFYKRNELGFGTYREFLYEFSLRECGFFLNLDNLVEDSWRFLFGFCVFEEFWFFLLIFLIGECGFF